MGALAPILGITTPNWAEIGDITSTLFPPVKAPKRVVLPFSPPASTPGVERDELIKIVSLCQEIKIEIVQKDPYEKSGLRHKLNLGHTIGHAIEAAAGGKLSHGQAVAIGLAAVSKLSVMKGLLISNKCDQIILQLKKLGLPTTLKGIDKQKVFQALKLDKKGGSFVLIKDIGQLQSGVKVETVLIEKVLEEVIV